MYRNAIGIPVKPPRPARFFPEECSHPACPEEGIHRWLPEQTGPLPSMPPLHFCDPHHEEAKRLSSDTPGRSGTKEDIGAKR